MDAAVKKSSRKSRFLGRFSGKLSSRHPPPLDAVTVGSAHNDANLSKDQEPSPEGSQTPCEEPVRTESTPEQDLAIEPRTSHDSPVPNTESLLTKTLWERACEEVEQLDDFRGFVVKYQKILLKQDPQDDLSSLATRKDGMKTLIDRQRKTLEEGRWGFMLLGRSFKVADVIASIINGIVKLEGTMGTILRGSGEPHAAMIVAGVSVLLPLITHPAAQDKSAMELLGLIFDRTSRYYVYEDILEISEISQDASVSVQRLRSHMQDKLVALYVEILKAQIALARRFARSSFLQYGRDIVKFDPWTTMQEAITNKDMDLNTDIQALVAHLGKTQVSYYLNLEAQIRGLYTLLEDKDQIARNEKNQQFLQYFSSTFGYQATVDKVDNRVEGTNEWVAKNADFIAWRASKKSSTMLVKAGAGRGKSVLLKHLLENELASSLGRVTLFFFFHRGSDLEGSAVECMNAILYQILEQQPAMVTGIREAFPNANANTRYHFDMLCKIIEFCIADFEGEIVLILDGLDECEILESPSAFSQRSLPSSNPEELRHNLTRFFNWLAKIGAIKIEGSNMKLLCSLRTGSDTAYHTSDTFKNLIKTELDLNAEHANSRKDMALYIKTKVSRPNITPDKQEALSKMLIELQQTSGSYLWLKLVFDILPKPQYETMSVDNFKKYLLSGEMDRVDKQFSELLPTEKDQQAIAKVIFSMILGSRRPLSTAELVDAVETVTGEHIEFDRPDVLAGYCSSFVEISTTRSNDLTSADNNLSSGNKRTVNFFHDRARTFLLKTPEPAVIPDASQNSAPSAPRSRPMAAVPFLGGLFGGLSMLLPQKREDNQTKQAPTNFHHGFSAEYVDTFMLDTCVKYISRKGSTGSIDRNVKSFTSNKEIMSWIPKYLTSSPFMMYAAIQWINHLPLDEENRAARALISQQVRELLDVSSTTFRTWFVCSWRIWSPDMAMEEFFGQYITAFVTDNLQPVKAIRIAFKLEDPGLKGAWLWWTASGDLGQLKTLMKLCEPGYQRPMQKRQWISSYESTSSPSEYRSSTSDFTPRPGIVYSPYVSPDYTIPFADSSITNEDRSSFEM